MRDSSPGEIEKQLLVHFQIKDLEGICQPPAPLRQDECCVVIDSHDSLLEEAMRIRSPDNTRLSYRNHRLTTRRVQPSGQGAGDDRIE